MYDSADEIITQLCRKHQSCESFSNSGIATSNGTTVKFKTDYARPDKFVFEYRVKTDDVWRDFAVRLHNGNAQTLVRGEWIERESLTYALTISAGASIGISPFLGRLLFRPIDDSIWSSLMPYTVVSTEDQKENQSVRLASCQNHKVYQETIEINLRDMTVKKFDGLFYLPPIEERIALTKSLPDSEAKATLNSLIDWQDSLRTTCRFLETSFEKKH